ncbi:MAG: hypothetical protein IKM38_07675 [Christensenellaceae bacterium]|nr:hypothetical protein [Christensenellaceae bacterium]
MFVKTEYVGFYPLGSDVKINNIEIMKSKWHVYQKPVITYGKKKTASPLLKDLFYVVSKGHIQFFVAVEWGLGHYHIFTVNEKQSRKLSNHIGMQNDAYLPIAVHINKIGHSIRVYGRIVSGARDINFKVDDSTFILIETTVFEDFTRYAFTNNGDDRFYLDVYSPSMTDHTELFILIGKADKVIWHWNSKEAGEIYQEYKLLDTYVQLTRCCSTETEILYFH